jgi:hypothetical protein
VGDASRSRISLVLSDDAEGLPPAIVAHERDGAAELHDGGSRIGHDQLRADSPRVPVANVSCRLGESFPIAAGLSLPIRALRGGKRGVELRQTGLSDIVRARRDRPVWEVTDQAVFVYERSAHPKQIGTLQRIASRPYGRVAVLRRESCARQCIGYVPSPTTVRDPVAKGQRVSARQKLSVRMRKYAGATPWQHKI